MKEHSQERRRPIRSRHTRFASVTAKWLAARGLRPNHISLLSIVFSAFAALCLVVAPFAETTCRAFLFMSAALFIFLRLLCNLFDGMLAIEEGLASPEGEIYNDFPDRPSDILILVGGGYAVSIVPGGVALGWLCAVLAVLTAYVRLLGVSVGTKPYFIGPMAKQQRMAVMIVACLLSAISGAYYIFVIMSALILIASGSFITIIRRLCRQIADLHPGKNGKKR